MKATYRKLFEVEIKHDYFLIPGADEKMPLDFNLSNVIAIAPTPSTERIMRDHKMFVKNTPTGFVVFVQAERLDSLAADATMIDFDPSMTLSFQWLLRMPRFLNFTNQRLQESNRGIYYFSNRTGVQQGTTRSLNKPIVSFGTTYLGEARYHLGDIVNQGGETYEMIEKESPATNFPANLSHWQKISTSIVNYVNPSDRLRWRSGSYHHERVNSNPGEFIQYTLLDGAGNSIDLGFVVGTTRPQREYISSTTVGDRVNHVIDLSRVQQGRYTMLIHELGGTTSDEFYLANTADVPDLLGISDLFVGGNTAPFQFVAQDAVTKRWILDVAPKRFSIRFRNRTTKWKYLNQDKTLFHAPAAPRPLTRSYSGYQIAVPGGTLKLPDPNVDTIIPELETNLVKNIFSEIFLSK
jgi:hypothetical protein